MNYLNGPLECETILVFTPRKEAQSLFVRRITVKFNFSETDRKQTNNLRNKNQKRTLENVADTNVGLFLGLEKDLK